jgi:hypothetical protein
MSHAVAFPLAASIREAVAMIKEPHVPIRAVFAVIENEEIVALGKPVEATVNLTSDLSALRKRIADDKIGACWIILKLDEKRFEQIMYVPDGIKPRIKMMYATSAVNLRNETHLPIGSDTHVVNADEINPTLFGRDIEQERVELRTDKEKIQAELAQLPVAPAPSGLPGVANPIDDAGRAAVAQFKAKEIRAASFTVSTKGIHVDKTLPNGSTNKELVAAVPENQPRFVIVHWTDDKSVLLYVCPASCKPKERMPYASTKASFVAQLSHQDVKASKSIETDSPGEIETAVNDALNAPALEDDVKPIAPKPVMPKGPRMLMPN